MFASDRGACGVALQLSAGGGIARARKKEHKENIYLKGMGGEELHHARNPDRRRPAAATETRPGAVVRDCSTWSIFDEGDAFGRQWIIRGLRGTDDLITVEIHVSAESIVTMVVEPGVEAGAVDVRGQLLTEGDPAAPFIPLQHCPVVDRPGASVFAPIDAAGLRCLLGALWQAEEMQLTLVAGERQVMEIPLYNDASFREIFAEISGS